MQRMTAADHHKLLSLMGWTPAAAAAWRADLARRHADHDASPEAAESVAREAAIIAEAKAKRAARVLADYAERAREEAAAVVVIRAPYTGAVVRTYRPRAAVDPLAIGRLESLMSTGGL